ncbi:MAG: hypothetical protein GY842_08400 [bacterium]|nr:hypothetical protein [bacterium]
MVDPHAAAQGGREVDGPQPTESKLDGVTLKIPDGWVYEAPEVNSRMPGMSPKAIFRLKPVEGDTENVYVRITHFPGMNVSDEMNLKRWYGMFSQPDGGATADAVSLERFEVGRVSFVVADIPGTMRVAGGSKSDWRMLGVIIKHDRGPHFMKVVGPAGSVEHWKDSVLAYLRSAIAN